MSRYFKSFQKGTETNLAFLIHKTCQVDIIARLKMQLMCLGKYGQYKEKKEKGTNVEPMHFEE